MSLSNSLRHLWCCFFASAPLTANQQHHHHHQQPLLQQQSDVSPLLGAATNRNRVGLAGDIGVETAETQGKAETNIDVGIDVDVDADAPDSNDPELDEWISAVWWSLKLDVAHMRHSKELKELLFANDNDAHENEKGEGDDRDGDPNAPKPYAYKEDAKPMGQPKQIPQQQQQQQKEGEDPFSSQRNQPWIVRGIPKRPFYKEVAVRLLHWNRQKHRSSPSGSKSIVAKTNTNGSNDTTTKNKSENIATSEINTDDDKDDGSNSGNNPRHKNNNAETIDPPVVRLVVPASALGFQESSGAVASLLPTDPPDSFRGVRSWLSETGDAGILRLLGLRDTVGSVRPRIGRGLGCLPSRERLEAAAHAWHAPPAKRKQKDKQKQHQKQKSQPPESAAVAASIPMPIPMPMPMPRNNADTSGQCGGIPGGGREVPGDPPLRKKRKANHPNSALTVAARARSKHAHRAVTGPSFFGVAKGSPSQQNKETAEILRRLLDDCVWINSHAFGGLKEQQQQQQQQEEDGSNHHDHDNKNENSAGSEEAPARWVLEIRQEEGYGARWLLEVPEDDEAEPASAASAPAAAASATKKKSSSSPSLSVTFRGFLEPQMEGGHENRWRH